jgi:hypothetical protein
MQGLARGHRDNVMLLDESADGEHQMPLEKKSQMIAFLIARNRPRKLSRTYERNHKLANREFRIILLSSSERALGQIARAAHGRRLGGEEVRFMDIPTSESGSSGIVDASIKLRPGKSAASTTPIIDLQSLGRTLKAQLKELVETLKADAIKHQGHALRALLQRYVNDPHGLETLRKYKQQFEREATIADAHNAYYRVRSNFALMYAAAALAIDYGILPWGRRSTLRAVEKCMRLALATAQILRVKPKLKVTKKQACARQKADGFKINGEIYIKPDPFKRWIPSQPERNALKEHKVIITDRKDTATIEKKVGGIQGKPRYYAIDTRALDRLASAHSQQVHKEISR